MKDTQSFVLGTELKEDLKAATDERNRAERSYVKLPPKSSSQLISKLWKKYGYDPDSMAQANAEELTDEEEKELVERIMRMREGYKELGDTQLAESEISFIEKRTTVSIDDPCPCGSGKIFRDCHWDKVQKGMNKDS